MLRHYTIMGGTNLYLQFQKDSGGGFAGSRGFVVLLIYSSAFIISIEFSNTFIHVHVYSFFNLIYYEIISKYIFQMNVAIYIYIYIYSYVDGHSVAR
jgi:hypothetical protein